MGQAFLDPTVAANYAAATTQTAQLEAVRAPWAGGNVHAWRYGAGDVLLQRVVMGPWTIDSNDPRGLVPGALVSFEAVTPAAAGGTPVAIAYTVYRTADAAIFRSDGVTFAGSAKALCAAYDRDVAFTSTAPASSAATSFSLSGPSVGINGEASTFTVTPNGPLAAETTVNISAPGATLSTSSLLFELGATAAQTFTVTRAADGTTSVSITNTADLSNIGSPRVFTSANTLPVAIAPATLANDTGSSAVRFSGGMAFKQGDIPSGVELTCADASSFQGSVLNRWPDGSVKFAVVAGQATVAPAGTLALGISGAAGSAGTPVAESVLITAAPQAVIGFSGVGTVALADLLGVPSALSGGRYTAGRVRTLFEGPLVSSWLYYSRIAGHEHLAAWFEVRCWADGAYEILPWIENGWWNVTGPTSYDGTATFTLGGSEVFSAAVTLHHHTRIPLLPSDAEPYRVGAGWATLLHDPAYLQSTELVPTYYTAAAEATIAGQVSTYVPMNRASVPDPMGAGGYSPSIGLLPEWDVCYVTTADKRARKTVLINAWSHGRWPIHYRDETTNRTPLYASYPTRVINTTAVGSVSSSGASSINDKTPATSGATPPIHASSHHPSVGFLAYLISGWNYCIDEMQMLSTMLHFKNGNLPRQNAKGIFLTSAGENTPRGAAWAWRSLSQTVALTPDDDAMRANFVGALTENIAYYHATYVAQANNAFGLLAPYGDAYTPAVTGTTLAGSTSTVILLDGNAHTVPEGRYDGWDLDIGGERRTVTLYEASLRRATVGVPFTVPTEGVAYRVGDNIMKVPIWQEDFVTGAVGYSLALDLPLATDAATKLTEFFHWKAKSVTGRFGVPGVARVFNYCDAAQYELAAAPSDTPDFVGGTGPWYANWGEIYEATLGTVNAATGSDQLRGDSAMAFPSVTGYWANMLPALSYAVRHRVPDADDALAMMRNDPNWATFLGQFNTQPLWGVKPSNAMPSWRTAQASGTVIEIPVAAPLSTLNPRLIAAINPNFPARPEYMSSDTTSWETTFTAWNGATFNYANVELGFSLQGGHADYAGNDYWVFRVLQGDWVRRSNPSGWDGTVTTNDGQEATGVYSDGRARSIHSYNKPVYAWLDKAYWIPVMGNMSWSGAAGTLDTVRIDEVSGAHEISGPATSTIAAAPSGGGGCYDPTRGTKGSLWWFGQGGSRLGRFDIAARTWETGPNIGARGGYQAICRLRDHDLILIAADNAPRFGIYDPVAGTVTNITVSGAAAGGVTDFGHAQPVYVPAANAVYWWNNPSGATSQINRMVVPADPKADAWTIETVAFTGVTPSPRAANGTYGRFGYSAYLDAFVLTNSVNGPVYNFARGAV